ncbi:MAG: GNAT family N-acetyltransferase [Sandaracinaceae bacterium]
MALTWIHEANAAWDDRKATIIAAAGPGAFDSRYAQQARGALVPGEWWRVEQAGRTVAYGWLDVNWGDAEILLAVDPEHRRAGVGTFVLRHLEAEAAHRGLRYLTNVVRATHPHADEVRGWLERRGFTASEDGRLLRAVVANDATAG